MDQQEVPSQQVSGEPSGKPDAAAFELLHAFPLPCVLADRVGRCIERNAAFDQVLATLPVRLMVGRIRFTSSDAHDKWLTCVADACDTAVPQSFQLEAAPPKPWRVHVSPLRSLTAIGAGGEPTVLVVFDDRLPLPQGISTARLTRAEQEVLSSVLKGLPAKAIANLRGASVNTVRAQIMSILEKTGRSSQRELIASSTFGSRFESSLMDSKESTAEAPRLSPRKVPDSGRD